MRAVLDNLPTGIEKQAVARVLDCCAIASERQLVKYTDFIDPGHRDFIRPLVSSYFGIRCMEDGGYSAAERKRLAIFPDYYRADDLDIPIALLEISLADADAPLLSHRHFLGALLGMGVSRGTIGDIILFSGGGQVFVTMEGKELLLSLDAVNRFSATTREVPPYQVRISQQPMRTINATVASLRLDAVLSAGLGSGRSRAAALVRGEKVRVNWRHISQPAFSVKQGDIITVRGRGRLEISAAGGQTRKGRTRISLKKYE